MLAERPRGLDEDSRPRCGPAKSGPVTGRDRRAESDFRYVECRYGASYHAPALAATGAAARREAARWQISRQSLDAGRADEPEGPRVRQGVRRAHRRRAHRGGQRLRRRAAARGGRRGRRAADGRRGSLLLPQLLQGHRPLRGAHDRRDERREGQGRLQQLAPGLGDEADAARPDARRVGRQDDVRHPLPDVAPRQRARAVGRRRRAHRHPHRRAPHDPDVARRRAVRQRPRGPGPLRPRGPRHRRPGEPRPGHERRPALLRHRRRRAHDPALRLVVRRQRAARQDRARPAAGGVRRLGEQEVPRRAVHAHRHPRQGDRQGLPHLRRLPERLRQDQPGDDGWPPTPSATATTCRSTATTSRGSGSTRSPAG